jgi:hypothetical protein
VVQHAKILAASVLAAALAGCGGGDSISTPAIAEGAWQGTTSAGYTVDILVLENNETWAMFGTNTNNYLTVRGFDRGSGTSSGNTFNGSGTEYSYTGSAVSGSFSGTVIPGASFNGAINGAQRVTFSTAPMPSSSYNYNTAAQLANVTGTWNGALLTGAAASVSVSATGALSGSSSGCLYTGKVAPRASGKNVFDVTLNFGGAPCILANQSVSGIAIAYLTTTGKTQLLAAMTNAANTAGTMFFAQR